MRLLLEAVVDLGGRLDEQEEAAGDEDEVAPGHLQPQKPKSGVVSDMTHVMLARASRMTSASDSPINPRAVALLGGSFRQDGDEDQVVDAEHDLQRDEGEPTQTVGSASHSMGSPRGRAYTI